MIHTNAVLDFMESAGWDEFPPEVQHQAKRCLLDTLGCLLAGMRTPVARIVADTAVSCFGGTPAARILVDGRCASPVGASLAHGFAANALDMDDGYRLVKGHPGACILPVLLTFAQTIPLCSGRDFLTALVVGYEVGIRAGILRHAASPSYHASGSWGALAGVAAGAKLLGMNRRTIREALGTAEYHAPIAPMMKCIDVPAMTKDGIGWGAMAAAASLILAEKGFTGIRPLFDDRTGDVQVPPLGGRYEMLNLYFKPYAACRWAQPAIRGALLLQRRHGLSVDDIARIQVRTFRAAKALGCGMPANTEEAQYNLAYPLATALLDGKVGPDQVLGEGLGDPERIRLAGKVQVIDDPGMDAAFPAKTLAEVSITLTDGRVFRSGVVEPAWEPPHTLPADRELEEKFLSLSSAALGDGKAHDLLRRLWDLDACHDIAFLFQI
ncbi:MAG: MmgE/PrpD family protein [Desulfacinum sp.]|jgi:2-methylcitrate dehydratase PrpD|nr:MmgE/PrpD family protein [Desulfacinum sp.]